MAWPPFPFGASNGNRTRIASLGSWSFTIRLYPRTRILYLMTTILSRGLRKFSENISPRFPPARQKFPSPDFFLSLVCTFVFIGHMMIMETGHPVPYFIFLREVHYEQLSLQYLRQQQLDLDRHHRSALHLLRLLMRLPPRYDRSPHPKRAVMPTVAITA